MHLWITGTDTDVGKTLISAWLCLHTGWAYHKPIQSGAPHDEDTVRSLSGCKVHPSRHVYATPASPHWAAALAGRSLAVEDTVLPGSGPCVVEGAGGVMVPLNATECIVDMLAHHGGPVLVVARNALGTLNHTLLTLQALRARDLSVWGVVLSGAPEHDNAGAIAQHGRVPVWLFPRLESVHRTALQQVPLPDTLRARLSP